MSSTSEFRPRVVAVTGGAGFIGSNLVRWLLKHEPEVQVVNIDALTYAGNLESLTDVVAHHGENGDGRYQFIHGDIRNSRLIGMVLAGEAADVNGRLVPMPDAVLHLAAESHVDRSILGPAEFVSTNVQGTLNLLECLR